MNGKLCSGDRPKWYGVVVLSMIISNPIELDLDSLLTFPVLKKLQLRRFASFAGRSYKSQLCSMDTPRQLKETAKKTMKSNLFVGL